MCHWFSEDVAAWKAVQVIGQEIQRTGEFDVAACREAWRRELRKLQAEDELADSR